MTLALRLVQVWSGFSLDVAFETESSGVTALFGPSGSGKSTIIKALAGLLRPREGFIALGGDVLLDTASGKFIPPRHRRMGVVFQDARLFPHLSVKDNLLFGLRRSASPAPAREVEHMIELLDLSPLLARLPRTLSGGEKQRVALGRALLSSPRLLLLDEPLAALGQAMKDEILPYLERLRDERLVPMIYVSHSVEEVARLADRLVVLDKGRVGAQGSVFDLFASLSPETRALSASAVLEARVARHLGAERLSELDIAGTRLLVPAVAQREATITRIRIFARDITIALDPPGRISANNVLEVVVGDIRVEAGEADVLLLAGGLKLIARITEHSLRRLALSPGMRVYAIVKSVTVDRGAGHAHS